MSHFSARTFSFPYIRGPLAFDVFHKDPASGYKKIFSQGNSIDPSVLASYILKGTTNFYILNSARNHFLSNSLSILQSLRGTAEIANESAQEVLDELAEKTLSDVLEKGQFTETTQAYVRGVVDIYLDLAVSHPLVLPRMILLARKKQDLVKHMIVTSVFSTLLARAFDPNDQELILAAGYAGFVHDIGLSHIDVNCDEHAINQFTPKNEKVRSHSAVGARLLIANKGIPDQVVAAVVQHHEAYDGSGYPNGLRAHSISLAGRIVAIAGYFSAMSCGSKFTQKEPPTKVIQKMSQSGKFDPKLIELLGNLLKLRF